MKDDDRPWAANESAEITVARSVEDVEAIRDSWQSADVKNLDSNIDYFLTVIRNGPRVIRPHVVRIRRSERPDLFGIARLENIRLPLTFGYKTLARPTIKGIVLTFDGIVGAQSAEDEKLVLAELERALRIGEADALLLQKLDVDGSHFALARSRAGRLLRLRGLPLVRCWMAEIPDSMDAFLTGRSAKTRQTFRRQDRRLERTYGDGLRLRRFERPDELDELCRDLETVAAKTYQRQVPEVGYRGDALDRALIELGLRRGWFRAWMLYLAEQPVAFWTGTTYAGTFTIGTPGFEPAHGKESVGRYVMLRMIEDLCVDEKVARLDFGYGDADYKEGFGFVAATKSDVFLLAPRLTVVAIGLLSSCLSVVNNWARRVSRESQWGRRLKRAWRRGLMNVRTSRSGPP